MVSRLSRPFLESLVLLLVPAWANTLFPHDPGFLAWGAAPYLVPGALLAAFQGLRAGLLQWLAGALIGLAVVPSIALWAGATVLWDLRLVGISAGLSLSLTFAAGFGGHLRSAVRRRFLDKLRSLVVKNVVLQREVSGLARVHRVLEERVANQLDSMTMLRNQIKKLAQLNLQQALQAILETVQLFTEMSSGAIYVLNPGGQTLRATVTLGWEQAPQDWEAPLEGSVVGYVFRNAKPFSLRMMLESHEFSTFSTGSSIMAYPIRVEGKVWGVLEVTGLPFERYSAHTESIVEIVLGLAEPYLGDILDYELVYQHYEHDQVTGLPLVTQLFQNLDRDLEKMGREGTPVSVLLLEVVNFSDLELRSTPDEARALFLGIKRGLDAHYHSKSRVFHYRSVSQLAVLATGLDQDGTTFYGMEIQALVPRLGLELRGEPVELDLLVGVATARANISGEALLLAAENLLTLQRL